MKTVTLLIIFTILNGTSGFLIKVPTAPTPTQSKIVPIGWIHLQKLILPLFENVCEPSANPIIIRLAQEFNLDSSSGIYLKPEVVVNLRNLKSGKGLLGKGEIFTEYNTDHIDELRTVYEVFFYAKDFNTFYTAAAWARQNVNCGLFVDAIYLALLNRRDTEKLAIPGPYELLPNYFFKKDVIVQASTILSGQQVVLSDNVRDEGNAYILDTNYTANNYDDDDESKLAYFHEDVGINTYYFIQKLKKISWSNTPSEFRYGEYLYHMMKQLSARYDLERYANSLPGIEPINLSSLTIKPYDSMLIYTNGNEFSQRTTPLELSSDDSDIEFLINIENNIITVVNHMRGAGYNKTEILNHLMEILVTGQKSYETVALTLIGKDTTRNIEQPSVVEHYLTSLRDPVFWKLNKKIVNLVDDSVKTIPSYMRNELYFPGIEILNVDVKKLMTSFDYFQIDVTDALKSSTSDTPFQVKIGQSRLNHKPFTIKLNISSVVLQKGLVKMYLGPKVAPGEFPIKKNLFMLLDSFEYSFKIGSNVISRSSDEMKHLSDDFTFLRTLRKNVEDAEFGLDVLPIKSVETMTGFPSRLILPKGCPEGLPVQMFVFVAPFIKTTSGGLYVLPNMDYNSAVLSPGYPLDLNIGSNIFDLSNTFIKDFVITHKGDIKKSNYEGSGINKKWQNGDTYDPTMRPDYSSKRMEPFDYASKKGQYEKKEDYSAKRDGYYKDNQNSVIQKVDLDISNEDNNLKEQKSLDTKNNSNEDLHVEVKDDVKNLIQNNSVINSQYNIPLHNEVPLLKLSQSSKIWQNGDNYDPSKRPNFYNKRKEPFDYASKKREFEKKRDYSNNRGSQYKYNQDTDVQNVSTDTSTEKIIENEPENRIVNNDNNAAPYVGTKDAVVIPLARDTNVIDSQFSIPLHNQMPLLKLAQARKRIPTVFDYILPKYSEEDYYTDEKVYE